MKRITVILFLISTGIALANTTSVEIKTNTPLFRVNKGINSSTFHSAPVPMIDENMPVTYYKFYRDEACTSFVWSCTYPSPDYFSIDSQSVVTLDTLLYLDIDTINFGISWLDTLTIDAMNDSIWAAWTNYWNPDKNYGTPDSVLFRLRHNFGNASWDYTRDSVSENITELQAPVAEGYARILFPGQLARYAYSFNWKTAVGPLDSTQRASAESGCGIDLPKRYSEYGIPEILKICNEMDIMPNFVYTRVSDTAYCVLDSFEYEVYHINEASGDTDSVTTTEVVRRSLGDDAREFAEYLFGDPATSGWAKLRERDGFPEPVNTDRIMIGNDLHTDSQIDHASLTLYKKRAAWPRPEITKALMDYLAVKEVDTSLFMDAENNWRISDRLITIRLQARLDTIATAFKSVNPSIRVGAFMVGPDPRWTSTHTYLGAAALAAEHIDYTGSHWYWGSGHYDTDYLNYRNTDHAFMEDTFTSVNYANRKLLNETLGDMAVDLYMKLQREWCDTGYQAFVESIFGEVPPIKPIEITELNGGGFNFYEKGWSHLSSIQNAIKHLEFKRMFNRISGDPYYDIEVVQTFHMKIGNAWAFTWGYDNSSSEEWESKDKYGPLTVDGGNGWYTSCGIGYQPPYLSHLLYKDVGLYGLDYIDNFNEYTARSMIVDSITYNPYSNYLETGGIDSVADHPDSQFTMVTIDPYIDTKGAINMIIVNRDTVGVCTLAVTLGDTIIFDSLDVWRLRINDSIWKEACYYVYGDSNFLPLGFAHNGFTYDSSGVKLRFQTVYLDSCDTINAIVQTIETDSSTYFALELDPMSFARVRVVPKQDSVAIILHPGWNLVSIPMYTGEASLSQLFSISTSGDSVCPDTTMWVRTAPAFVDSHRVTSINRWFQYSWSFGHLYLEAVDYRDSVNTPGESYWVYYRTMSDNPCTVFIHGVKCHRFLHPLIGIGDYYGLFDRGHVNLIGSVWEDRMFKNNSEPTSLLYDSTSIWIYNAEEATYEAVTCIEPTVGHLLLAQEDGNWKFPDMNYPCTSSVSTELEFDDLYYALYCPPGLCDTASLDVELNGVEITVRDRFAVNNPAIDKCIVWIETEDTTVLGYTDSTGVYSDDLIDVNDSTYIFLYKPGYRKLLVYPYGAMDSDTFQSDIVIYGDITVGSNDTLVILPGTNIYAAYRSDMMQTWMAERIDIVVQGHIIAVGDSLAPITFTVDVPADSTPAPNDWKGIVHHYSGGGEYEHCRFEYMRYFQGHQPGGDVTFKNCTFAKPLYNAISYGTSRPSYIDPPKLIFEDCQFDTIGSWNSIVLYGTRDSTRISNCVFDSAASYVFEVKDSGKAIIEACSLNSCYGILAIHDCSSVTMSDCDLNTGGSWYGFNVYDAGTLNIDNSLIARSSSGTGPRIYNAGSAEFRYCSITDFTSDGISCESATADMGTDKDLGHNCVWSDHSSANRLYFATKTADEFSVFGNWIDTLIFGGPSASEIDTGSFFPPDSCDTSIAKIVIEPEDKNSILPNEFELGPARPNPFNCTVTFDYKVPVECEIEIAIYDILGNKIRILFDGTRGSGIHSEVWDGKDDKGRTVASGTYLYRLKADDYEETRKMTFLK